MQDALSFQRTTDHGQRTGWVDLALLALLVLIAVAVRAWLLANTTVPARDSIGFIRYAFHLESGDWAEVIRKHHQHPGYPVAIHLVSLPVRHLVSGPLPYMMQLSAQLASALAAVLLVIPMYYLGKRLFHCGAGFWGAALFQLLPHSGHVLSDGLSEALYLLMVAWALLLACRAVQTGSRLAYALCGAFSGLAYLTRPEGALVLIALFLVLLGLQAVPAWRRPWGRVASCAAALLLSATAVGSPYVLITGRFTNKPSVHQFMGEEVAQQRGEWRGKTTHHSPLTTHHSPLFAVIVEADGALPRRLLRGLRELGAEVVKGFHYVAWAPVLLGVCWHIRRVGQVPGIAVLLLLCLLQTLVLWRLALVVGYVSDRHILVLVLCGVYPGVAALQELPARLAGWLTARFPTGRTAGWCAQRLATSRAVPLLLLVGLVAFGLPRTLEPLHAHRAGHHAAGRWLAAHADASDPILDSHCWAHFYAGRVFLEGRPVKPPLGHRPTCYHVVNRSREKVHPANRPSPSPPEKELVARGAWLVFHWPADRPPERARVVIYALPRQGGGPAHSGL